MAKSDFETFLREEVAGSNEYEYGSGIPMRQDAIDFLAEVARLRAALTIYGERQNWHYERWPSEYVHPNEVNLYSWVGDGFRAPWQLANKVLEKDGDA